jgi:SPW repeat-containing protein
VKHLMRFNLGLGLWLMISPFVLALLNQRMFRLLWEDFVLGFGIATFSLWRLWSRAGAAFADFMMMTLGLTTLLNPILYHYFNVEIAAWNNLAVGFVVLILAIYQDRKDSVSSR